MSNLSLMKPGEYEEYVASLFRERGYETILTPLSNDWGIDVIATKGDEKIAVQAKMYGHTSRKVNRAAIMQLYGAMAYQDCTNAVLATDGEVLDDAVIVADKLGIEILFTGNFLQQSASSVVKIEKNDDAVHETCGKYPSFDEMWKMYVMPLKGKTLSNSRGDNRIVDVDWAGITRVTSNGRKGKIPVEAFRLAYNALLSKGKVTRDYINQQIDRRCSSGVVLILSQVSFIALESNPLALKLRM